MKKLILIVVLMPLMALADKWTDPSTGIEWTYVIQSDETVSLGNGFGYPAVSESTMGTLIIPRTINGKSVTSIGSYAFLGCSRLTSVTIPSSVTSIGEWAFSGTPFYDNLPDGMVILGSVLYAYRGDCPSVVTIPKGVTSIGSYAFWGCEGLTSVTIPPSVTSIGVWAFEGCSGLEGVYISDLAAWCGIKFANSSANPLCYAEKLYLNGKEVIYLDIPNGVEAIGQYAFYNCNRFMTATIPQSVTNIGCDAFYGCTSIKSVSLPETFSVKSVFPSSYENMTTVTIPANATEIADSAFDGCKQISSIDIPTTVTHIGSCAFRGCSGLTLLIIPENVTDLGASAFSGCNRIREIVIPEGVGELPASLFEGCSGLTTVTTPNSVTNISSTAFKDCGSVVSVTMPGRFALEDVFPSSYTKIKNVTILDGEEFLQAEVFAGCSALTTVVISEGVTTLGEDLFYNLRNLTELTIPSTVTSIGGYALYGCTSLEVIHVSNDCDIDALKQMLYESGFDVESVTFDHVKGFKIVFDPNGGIAGRSEMLVQENAIISDLPSETRENHVFLGWFTAEIGGMQVTADTVVTKDMTLYAHWRANDSQLLVPGEKVEWDTGLVGYTASGLPPGLAYNRTTGVISGATTKPGEYVVKFAKSGADTEEMTIVVTVVPKVLVEMAGVNSPGDTDGCKATGAGEYLVGKTVTLKATVPKGTVFMGWYDADGEGTVVTQDAVATQATYSFTMGKEDVALVAKFKKERMSVGCDALEYGTFTVGVACGFGSGLSLDEGAGITTESGVKSIAVNKLPAGMKFDARTHLLTGWPTKAGTYPVEIVVTANSGAVERKSVDLVVEALPAWAVGDFAGTVTCADGTHGTASMKIDAAGKVTNGKLLEHGSNWTFTASSYATTSVARGPEQDYVVFAVAKCGKAEREIELHVTGWASEGVAENAASAAGFFGDAAVELWRNVWKDADAKGVVAGIAGKYTSFLSDGTPLPLDLKATAALSGKANIRARDNASVSFSTTVFASSNGVEAAFYVAPDASKGYGEIYERFVLVPESGAREPGIAHRAPGVVAVPEPYLGDSGSGTVSVSPAGGQVDAGKTVMMSAMPDSKSVFVKWRYEVGGTTLYSEMSKLTLTMDGEHDVKAWAIFRSKGSFAEPVVTVEASEQSKFRALELGVKFSATVTVTDVENMKPVKWSAANLPSGLKINAETGEISGVATAVNTRPITITATSVADPKKKTTFTLDLGVADGKPAALPETAVGTFTGFVNNGTDNLGTFTFTSSEKGAVSAKVVDATGTVSFSGTGFAWSLDGKYGVELETKKGEKLSMTLDSTTGWDKDQLTGTFTTTKGRTLNVTSQRNAFSKAWYFTAEGDETSGWTFAYTKDAKAAALTVTLKADGTTSIAGKLPNGVDKNGKAVTLPVSASGVANAGMMREGAMAADFAPVLTVNKVKTVLAIRTNLWFDRKNEHETGIGEAKFAE